MKKFFCLTFITLVTLCLPVIAVSAGNTINTTGVYALIDYGWNSQDWDKSSVGFEFGKKQAFGNWLIALNAYSIDKHNDEARLSVNWDPATGSGNQTVFAGDEEYGAMLKTGYTASQYFTIVGGIGYSSYEETRVSQTFANNLITSRSYTKDDKDSFDWYAGGMLTYKHLIATGGYSERRGPTVGIGYSW